MGYHNLSPRGNFCYFDFHRHHLIRTIRLFLYINLFLSWRYGGPYCAPCLISKSKTKSFVLYTLILRWTKKSLSSLQIPSAFSAIAKARNGTSLASLLPNNSLASSMFCL